MPEKTSQQITSREVKDAEMLEAPEAAVESVRNIYRA